ncbi:MAG: carboxylating nicotinate-nucleotide diphosphorylase [Planctomycetota bacterium]|jgi:nicotinate-nucleotide pyrophosphorylase (carboxylating)
MPDPGPPPRELVSIIERVLAEDLGPGDLTTGALLDERAMARAEISFREKGVMAGGIVAELVLRELDVETEYEQLVPEGGTAEAGAPVIKAVARSRTILAGERVLLNFVAHLSGIATLTASFIDAVEGTGVEILDTRKTTPGLRALEKYAVRAGGGTSHRMGLHDAVLIKDNHLTLSSLSPAAAAAKAKARVNRPVEVEVTTLEDALACARAGADVIMLDNFDAERARSAIVALRAEFPKGADYSPTIEISGGVTLENVREYAHAGPDRISVGALTHSAASLDVTLDVWPL